MALSSHVYVNVNFHCQCPHGVYSLRAWTGGRLWGSGRVSWGVAVAGAEAVGVHRSAEQELLRSVGGRGRNSPSSPLTFLYFRQGRRMLFTYPVWCVSILLYTVRKLRWRELHV